MTVSPENEGLRSARLGRPRWVEHLRAATPLQKVSMVAGGYLFGAVAATLAVCACMALHQALGLPDDDCMEVIGYALVFGAVFTVSTIPPACGGFYFLRPARGFWRGFSLAATGFGFTGLIAMAAIHLAPMSVEAGLGFVRLMLSPVEALGFLLGAIFAPAKRERGWLLVAAGMEVAAFCGWFFVAAFRGVMG